MVVVDKDINIISILLFLLYFWSNKCSLGEHKRLVLICSYGCYRSLLSTQMDRNMCLDRHTFRCSCTWGHTHLKALHKHVQTDYMIERMLDVENKSQQQKIRFFRKWLQWQTHSLFWHLFPVYPSGQEHTLFLMHWPLFLHGGLHRATKKMTHK